MPQIHVLSLGLNLAITPPVLIPEYRAKGTHWKFLFVAVFCLFLWGATPDDAQDLLSAMGSDLMLAWGPFGMVWNRSSKFSHLQGKQPTTVPPLQPLHWEYLCVPHTKNKTKKWVPELNIVTTLHTIRTFSIIFYLLLFIIIFKGHLCFCYHKTLY